ncbi:MAG: hypothetical protein ABL958_19165, partial [Bdellovibrionia bacterium]
MKALLIQSLILLFATVAHAYAPKGESHDVTLDYTPVAMTAKVRNMVYKNAALRADRIDKMAKAYCRDQNFANVAEDAAGRPIYRTLEVTLPEI